MIKFASAHIQVHVAPEIWTQMNDAQLEEMSEKVDDIISELETELNNMLAREGLNAVGEIM